MALPGNDVSGIPSSSSSKTKQHRQQQQQQQPLVSSRKPHKLGDGRGTFLGFRNAKDAGVRLQSSVQPLMPDGGLSPCIIRVLGVGGGGCNAVRC